MFPKHAALSFLKTHHVYDFPSLHASPRCDKSFIPCLPEQQQAFGMGKQHIKIYCQQHRGFLLPSAFILYQPNPIP